MRVGCGKKWWNWPVECLRVLRAVDGFMGNVSVVRVSRTNVTHMFKFAVREGTLGVLGLIPMETNFAG